MMRIDEDMLMAFADGELDEIARARVERALAEDEGLRARLETQQRLRARLAAHYAPSEDVPERFRAMLETNVVALPPASAPDRRPLWQALTAIAATLVLGIAVGRTLPWGAAGPVGTENGMMVARGFLADALETQLASAQAPGDAARIGISFTGADGRICRTFESASLAGLACRGDDNWQLVMTAAGSGARRSEYRQAGSGSALILQAAQDMISGEPLDAEAERRARDAGWRRASAE